jgi:hypothetical protein
LLKLADFLEVYIGQVRSAAFERASAGEKLPGFKFVNKRGKRAWSAEEATILSALELHGATLDEIMPRELVTPAGADKVVRERLKARGCSAPEIKKALEALAFLQDKPGSQNVELVEADDPRPQVDPKSIAGKNLVKLPTAAPLGEQRI